MSIRQLFLEESKKKLEEIKQQSLFPDQVSRPYMPTYTPTSNDIDEYEEREQARKVIGTITKYGLSMGAFYLVKKALERQEINRKVAKYIAMNYLAESIHGSPRDALKAFGNGRVTLSSLAINTARAFEELSPFSILRTFQTSHILQPFASAKGEYKFTKEMAEAQIDYLQELSKRFGTRNITDLDIVRGLTYRDGKLFDADGEVIVKNARLVTPEWRGAVDYRDQTSMYNRILRRHLAVTQGYSEAAQNDIFNLSKAIPGEKGIFTIIAEEEGKNINHGWLRSAFSQAISQGFNIVNEPFGFLEETVGTMINKDSGMFKFINKHLRINPEATQDTPLPKLVSGYVKHGATKLAIAGAAFYALDNAAKIAGGKDSGYDKGIIEGVSTSYVNARIAYAKTVSDRFEEYTAQQEYMAPGSTSLIKLAGLPLAGAMLGGTVAYSSRLIPSVFKGGFAEGARESHTQKNIINNTITNLVDDTPISNTFGMAAKGRRYATRGGLIGAALALPFLPGALFGESSEELIAEYSGQKEVENRSNRAWFSGSNPIEGDGTKFFTKSWYQRVLADNKDTVLYGTQDNKEDLDPFLSPFDYLRNPYKFEEQHKHDMPYPVWGMDVSVGGWAGRLFQMSFGQIIKPDIINPELENLSNLEVPEGFYYDKIQEMMYPEFKIEAKDSPSIQVPTNYSNKELSLISDNKLLPKRNLSYNPDRDNLRYLYNSSVDYIGLKGWATSLFVDEFVLFNKDISNELARSGESTNFAREFAEQNLGGLLGASDILRRIVPMSKGTIEDRYNPLSNQVAPSWLPHDETKYRTDFSKGSYWDSVELGPDRLPGAGYEYFNPELKGLSPEEYPDIHKYKILADVAYGSNEFYKAKEEMTKLYTSGEMSDSDKAMFEQIHYQNQERAQKKAFNEYRTDDDVEGISLFHRGLGALWEGVTHNAELPTERLTFFRPAGKMLHQRTAIEDYRRTQIIQGDTALWPHPYSHFIRPFIEDTIQTFNEDYIPEHTIEKRNIDNYFDALEYYKQMKVYRESYHEDAFAAKQAKMKAGRTRYGAVASGLDTRDEVESAYLALGDEERQYFASFVNANPADRKRIAAIVDETNTRQIYEMMWRRNDAIHDGNSPSVITEEEDRDLISSNRLAYEEYLKSGDSKMGISFRERVQEIKAQRLIEEATGMPDEDFVGWDPRIDIKDVKLRSLKMTKEDLREFGFWQKDEEELKRKSAILLEEQVTTQLNSIKNTNARHTFFKESVLKDELWRSGVRAVSTTYKNVGHGDTDILIN